jgi:hypothetical protein
MPHIRIDIDEETYSALMHKADEELRPLHSEAAVILRRALGLPFPYPSVIDVLSSEVKRELLSAK